MYYKKKLGNKGEIISAKYLENLNYKILCKNFSCYFGEIDLIALDRSIVPHEVVFIEVKTRTNTNCGNPAEAITYYKTKHLYKTASYFLYLYNLENYPVRFDAIEIINSKKIHHIKKAIIDSPY